MPLYEYFCEANQRTVEVVHPIDSKLRIWGEVCYAARIDLGDTDPGAPVTRILTAPLLPGTGADRRCTTENVAQGAFKSSAGGEA